MIAARGLSSAMSAANAIKDHMYDWFHGTKPVRGRISEIGHPTLALLPPRKRKIIAAEGW